MQSPANAVRDENGGTEFGTKNCLETVLHHQSITLINSLAIAMVAHSLATAVLTAAILQLLQ